MKNLSIISATLFSVLSAQSASAFCNNTDNGLLEANFEQSYIRCEFDHEKDLPGFTPYIDKFTLSGVWNIDTSLTTLEESSYANIAASITLKPQDGGTTTKVPSELASTQFSKATSLVTLESRKLRLTSQTSLSIKLRMPLPKKPSEEF